MRQFHCLGCSTYIYLKPTEKSQGDFNRLYLENKNTFINLVSDMHGWVALVKSGVSILSFFKNKIFMAKVSRK